MRKRLKSKSIGHWRIKTEREKERKRQARKVVKDLNTVGFKALVSQPIDKDDDNQYLDREVTA